MASRSKTTPTSTPAGLDGVRFRDCLCLRMRMGARQITSFYDAFLAPSGLRITQFGLLAALEDHGKPLAVAALAAGLMMDPTTLNRNLKPLEREGLLRMEASARDRRVKEISLTATGRHRLAQAAPLWKAANERAARALGAKNSVRLGKLLDQSVTEFSKGADDPGDAGA